MFTSAARTICDDEAGAHWHEMEHLAKLERVGLTIRLQGEEG